MADTPEPPASSVPLAKPATTRRRAPRAAATKAPRTKSPAAKATKAEAAPKPSAVAKRPAPAKPRSSNRAAPAPKKRAPAKLASETSAAKTGSKWSKAAVVGGIAAIGAAATAALLSLRGSTPKDNVPGKAHTADGTDASASFAAGIADENVVPDKA